MPTFLINSFCRSRLIAILILAAVVLAGTMSAAQNPGRFQALHKKAEISGQVRVIVTVTPPRLPGRALMAPRRFDRLLTDSAHAAQSRVIDTLRPDAVVEGPRRFPFTAQFLVTVTAEGFETLAANPDVIAINEDVPDKPFLDQSVPHIFASHDTSLYSGSGWTVAVLDSGVDKKHPFLAGKVVAEACYSTTNSIATSVCPGGVSSSTAPDSGLPCPQWVYGCDHGTHVAGIAAGSGDTFDGVARNAELIAVQVFSRFDRTLDCGSAPIPCAMTYTSDQIMGLQQVYALRTTYAIASVNMSLGGGYYTAYCDWDSRKETIDLLKDAGIATVIASGNDSHTNGVSAPGCISTAITVGATNDTVDTRAWFSNSGPQLDLYAPGVSIYSSVPDEGYASWGGTSMAAPHVAGAWALLKEKYPTETVDEIETRFDDSGVTVSSDGISRQRIDIDEALGEAIGSGLGFISVAPCRIVDTRLSDGMVTAGTARGFKVYGSDTDIREQGGTGDCGISWTSRAVMLNITSTGASDNGYLSVYPYNSSLPENSTLNVASGQTVANATLSRICQPSCLQDIAVYSSTNSHVVIDVMGYME
ncbi:MAG: S8 family serine peptidase [Desulfobulbaceae bacterium]|nr:S8 family serine peptidase [Desulfobulbaceae bacterium]